MKKIFAFLLALCMVVGVLPGMASASSVVYSGQCGENLTWTLDDTGKLTISGSGPMENYTYNYWAPWYGSRSSITTVVIEQGVTTVGGYAFYRCTSLTGITIPQSVISSGYNAFGECSGLKNVYFSGKLKDWCAVFFDGFGSNPMSFAEKLYINNKLLAGEVTVPDGITSLKHTFCGCTSLTGVTIPDTVTSIGDSAFSGCTSLTEVVIPDSVTSIGDSAFRGCTSLTGVTIPDSVTTIKSYAFFNCSKLESITFPDSITNIGMNAFAHSGLTLVHYTGSQTHSADMNINLNGEPTIDALPWHYGVRVNEVDGQTVYDCSQCGMYYYADGTEYTPVAQPSLICKSFSLSFEDEIKVNYYGTMSDTANVTELGLLVFYSNPGIVTAEKADEVHTGAVIDDTRFMITADSIAAKEMGDERFYCSYAKLSDGIVVYSDLSGYSPKKYAMNMLSKESTSEKQKKLCVAMLNYGAAAQEYFGYNADNLMNAELTDEQKAMVEVYDSSLFNGAAAAPSTKVGSFLATDGGFSRKSATVSFEGAFSINYYFTPDSPVDGTMTFYYWNAQDFDAAEKLSPSNATGSITMADSGNGTYRVAIEGIAAKSLDEAYYVAVVYYSELALKCTGVIPYSLSKYCLNKDSSGMANLAQSTAMYGYYAAQYFA